MRCRQWIKKKHGIEKQVTRGAQCDPRVGVATSGDGERMRAVCFKRHSDRLF